MKPAWSLTSTGSLPQARGEGDGGGHRVVGGGDGPDHLDQRHGRRRVEEVDAADQLGPAGGHGHLDHRQGRGVGGQDGARLADVSSSAKRAFLTARSSTTDSMTRSTSASSPRCGGGRDPGRDSSRVRLGALALLHLLGQRLAPGRPPWRRRWPGCGCAAPPRSPAAAATSAMPEPMIPDPTIPTRLIDMGRRLLGGNRRGRSRAGRRRRVQEWRHGHTGLLALVGGGEWTPGLHLRRQPAGRLRRHGGAGAAHGRRLPAPRAGGAAARPSGSTGWAARWRV